MSFGSPSRRKSLSLLERNLNANADIHGDGVIMATSSTETVKVLHTLTKSVSTGSIGTMGPPPTESVGDRAVPLSPRRQARRSLKPRKSILKSLSSNSLHSEDATVDYTMAHGHTVAFGRSNEDDTMNMTRSGVDRRVSFAGHAHVRMFDTTKDAKGPRKSSMSSSSRAAFVPDQVTVIPRRQSVSKSTRRSSVQAPAVEFAGPQYFVGEGAEEGEASMDEETDEEEDYSDEDDRVEMGRPSTSLGMRDEDAQGEEEETEDENDQSMEIEETVNLGRILPRQSLAGSSRQSLGDISDQGAALNVSTDNNQHQEQGDRSVDQSDMSMDTSIEGSSRGDNDDRTMDFTIPVGRVLPSIPPDNATKGSIPLGYSVPDSPDSQIDRIHPGEPTGDDMEMEETVAFGGIVEDDTVSSASSMDTDPLRERTATYSFGYGAGGIQPSVVATNDAEDGMDMTVATGGILAGQSPAFEDEEVGMEMTVATGGILGQTQSYPAISPARLPTNTRPMSGTPSFARPTSSSLQRSQSVKRNVFAPSPASAKADRTPRKSGMATAGEVAKRLSFTSTTSSGGSGKKRPLERDENEPPTPGSAKKPKPSPATSIGEGVFGVPASSPVEATSSPRKTIVASPRKSILPSARKSILPSPRRSLGPPSLVTPRKSVSTQASSAATPSNGGTPARSAKSSKSSTPSASSADLVDADGPITLSEFLRMAQVQFADGQTVTKRRISVGRHGLAHPTGERVFGLEEYAEAQIQGVMYETYEWACDMMKGEVQNNDQFLKDLEAACSDQNPLVVTEYLRADPYYKEVFESTFKAQQSHARLQAQAKWHQWVMTWLPTLRPEMEALLGGMREDEQRLDETSQQVETLLPDLQARYEALQRELESERAVVSEIETCDQVELAELKAAIAEQGAQVATFTADYKDASEKLEAVLSKLTQVSNEKKEHVSAIEAAKGLCDQYTRSDVLKLKEEYDSLQSLHQWKVGRISPRDVEMVFADQVRLTLECVDAVPDLTSATLGLTASEGVKTRYPLESTRNLFAVFQSAVSRLPSEGYSTLPRYVQRVGELWTAAQRLRVEIGLLALRYPTSIKPNPARGLTISTTFMAPSARSRVEMGYTLTEGILTSWPVSLAKVGVSASVVYGQADAHVLSRAAERTLSAVSADGYVGLLVQACVDAQASY